MADETWIIRVPDIQSNLWEAARNKNVRIVASVPIDVNRTGQAGEWLRSKLIIKLLYECFFLVDNFAND